MLIVDDILATGGSLKCVVDLVTGCPADNISVVACFVIDSVPALREEALKRLAPVDVVTLLD